MSATSSPVSFQVLSNLEAYSYTDVASAVILVYDYLLTLPSEVNYVWPGPRSISAFLFFVTRYPPFLDTSLLLAHSFMPVPLSTYAWLYRAQVCSYAIGLLASSVILILRTTAIWNKDRRVLIGLSLLLTVVVAAAAYSLFKYFGGLIFIHEVFPSSPGNSVENNRSSLYIPYALMMGFETVILILTLIKVYGPKDTSPLHRTVYYDSLRFYIYLFAISVANTITLAAATQELRPILTSVHRALHAIFSGRIILNIYEAAEKSCCAEDCSSCCHPRCGVLTSSFDCGGGGGGTSFQVPLPVWRPGGIDE